MVVKTEVQSKPVAAAPVVKSEHKDVATKKKDQATVEATTKARKQNDTILGDIEYGADSTGNAIIYGAKTSGSAIKSGAEYSGNAIVSGAESTGSAIKSGA